jgi:hypothetical protein
MESNTRMVADAKQGDMSAARASTTADFPPHRDHRRADRNGPIEELKPMTDPIVVSIPIALIVATILRRGVITDDARAEELARELHDIVAAFRERFFAETYGLSPLSVADLTLAVWRQALVSGQDDTPDGDEAEWISENLAGFGDHDLFLRWLMIGDVVTGSGAAATMMMMEGGVH